MGQNQWKTIVSVNSLINTMIIVFRRKEDDENNTKRLITRNVYPTQSFPYTTVSLHSGDPSANYSISIQIRFLIIQVL